MSQFVHGETIVGTIEVAGNRLMAYCRVTIIRVSNRLPAGLAQEIDFKWEVDGEPIAGMQAFVSGAYAPLRGIVFQGDASS